MQKMRQFYYVCDFGIVRDLPMASKISVVH